MFLIFFTFFLFASAIYANKILLFTIPPTFLVGIRMFIAGIILLLIRYPHYPLTLKKLKRDWIILTITSLLTTCIPALLKAYSLLHLKASHTTLLGCIDPFVTALYAYILWQEKLTPLKIFGICLGISGIILSLNLDQFEGAHFYGYKFLLPQFAAIGAVFIGRWGWMMIRSLLRANHYHPAQLNGIIMFVSGFASLCAFFSTDALTSISITSSTQFWLLMFYTIIIGNVIAYTLYAIILKSHNTTLLSLSGFSVPLYVSFLSWFFDGQAITSQFIAAASIIFLGQLIFYLDNTWQKKKEPVSPPTLGEQP